MILNNYPYTNFHELNLDYLLRSSNDHERRIKSLEAEAERLNTFVKNVEIVASSYLKVTFGNDIVKTYALPTGTNFTFTVQEEEGETSLLNLEVDEEQTYTVDCTRAQFNEALNSGLAVVMRYFVYNILNFPLTTITINKVGGYGDFSFYDHSDIDHSNWQWKSFQIGFNNVDDVDIFYIKRIY